MSGKHKMNTIAFRPNTTWEYLLINNRAKLSGIKKKDFITRSCIYSQVCVVGKKEMIKEIISAVYEIQSVIKELVCQLKAGECFITETSYKELEKDILTMCIAIVEILDGAAYLFEKEPKKKYDKWKAECHLEEFRKMLENEYRQEL